MKIIILGNIGSGKTTILKKLNQNIHFDEVIIDEFRIKYGDNSLEGETLAREHFYSVIKENKNQFIECTGVGDVATKLYQQLKEYNEHILLLILLAHKEICLERIENRIWNIPFPFKDELLSSKVARIEKTLSLDAIKREFSQKGNLTIISKKNENPEDENSIIQEVISFINSNK
ncbi:MAG: hypothetical protein PSV16_00510 [Flavobacterium sp.]|nr:hypothetical protein [Flavobacterium sp.]